MSNLPANKSAKRILIIGTSWLGDSVITIPTIFGIRDMYPESYIAILAKDTIAGIFRAVSAINEIIPYSKKKGFVKYQALLATAGKIRKMGFDLAIIFPRSLTSALISFFSGIPVRIGFDAGIRGMFLTNTLKRDEGRSSIHQVHYYKKLLKPLGNSRFPDLPALVLPQAEKKWSQDFLLSESKHTCSFTVGLNPGSTYGEAKQWPSERFKELAKLLDSKHNCKIIIFGDSKTGKTAEEINFQLNNRAIDATGRTTVLQLAALLEQCDLLITNDTGPMHVACAVGTPVVSIFGSTNPLTTSPLGPDSVVLRYPVACSPCLKRECPEGHHRCMLSISVDEVAGAVLNLLKVSN